MRNIMALLLVLLISSAASGQITVPDEVQPFEPIIAGCNCIVPKDGQVTFLWRVDSKSRSVPVNDSKVLHIWAGPGEHWIDVVAIVQTFREVTILEPDPTDPADLTKAKPVKIRIPTSFPDIQRYDKTYNVLGATPTPTPIPGPGPGPTPTGFAGEVRKWLQAVPEGFYKREKILMVADNFDAVVAKEAAVAGTYPDLQAFTFAVKALNQRDLTTNEIMVYTEPFFRPLAQYQSKLFADRGLTTRDIPGLKKLYTDTAEAIRTGAP